VELTDPSFAKKLPISQDHPDAGRLEDLSLKITMIIAASEITEAKKAQKTKWAFEAGSYWLV
jgi:hypothetical protein